MDEQLEIIVDLVAALSLALAGGWLAARFRLSPILGYLAAGLIISPFTPGFVGETERLRLLADIGVVLLMFGVGVQFSIEELLRAGPRISMLALMQIGGTMALGCLCGLAFGWSSMEALFFGAAVALGSSTIMAKVIDERGEAEAPHARIALTWSVAQDLATVLLVVLLGFAAESEVDGGDLALTGLKTFGFLVGVVVVGVRVVPLALDRVADVQSREVFLLAIASLALGIAAAAGAVGISLALGAFLAGLVVSESDRSHQVLGEILPGRDVFGVLFFVSFGLLIDPAILRDEWHVLAIAVLLIVVVKFVLSAAPLAFTGTGLRTACLAGALLVPTAELPFVVLDVGIGKDAVSEDTFSTTLTAAGASIFVMPAVLNLAQLAPARSLRRSDGEEDMPADDEFRGHAIVSGYWQGGRYVADLLHARNFHVVVVEEDRRLVQQLRDEGMTCVMGTISNEVILKRLNLRRARLFCLAEPDPITAELAVRRTVALNPRLDIIARAATEEERLRLLAAGAREVVVAEQEAGLELGRHALMRYGVDRTQAAAVIQRLRGPA
jgi:CPA2 family monovalent cation:H+ antiporter-2